MRCKEGNRKRQTSNKTYQKLKKEVVKLNDTFKQGRRFIREIKRGRVEGRVHGSVKCQTKTLNKRESEREKETEKERWSYRDKGRKRKRKRKSESGEKRVGK